VLRAPSSRRLTGSNGESFWLGDGRRVRLRAVETIDEAAIGSFLNRLCLDSRMVRFFSAAADVRTAARWAASVDRVKHQGIVALDSPLQLVLGHAAYVRNGGTDAEVAVEVADSMHFLGLGTLLLFQLGRIAEANGVDRFVADVLPENHEMLAVFHDGFDPVVSHDQGVVKVAFATSSWRLARSRFGDRTRL
jgi:hypothetical protein